MSQDTNCCLTAKRTRHVREDDVRGCNKGIYCQTTLPTLTRTHCSIQYACGSFTQRESSTVTLQRELTHTSFDSECAIRLSAGCRLFRSRKQLAVDAQCKCIVRYLLSCNLAFYCSNKAGYFQFSAGSLVGNAL